MPRTSRTTVEFPVGDPIRMVRASFHHQHSTDGHMFTLGQDKRTVPIVHVTRCNLACPLSVSGLEAPLRSDGLAKCSAKDTYNWRHGVKLSFVRAVDNIPGMTQEIRGQFLKSFYTEIKRRPDATE